MDLIYPPTLDFHHLVQRPQQLMRQFARHGHRVFFCNLTQEPRAPITQEEPGLFLVRDHAAFLAEQVEELVRPLVWCSWAKLHDQLDRYRPGLILYDCLDDFPDWRPYEPAMLARADLVTVSSQALLERMRPAHQRVLHLPNGCDFDHFASPPAPRPADLPPAPVAGFVGAWAAWVDGELLQQTAALLPSWRFAIIGPPFGGPPAVGANIRFLGHRPYAALPAYLQHLDVALIPFRLTPVTEAANPVKLWEYLAAGLPVVSTPLREVLPLQGLVRLADDARAFADAILAASLEREPTRVEARRDLARHNTWAARYQRLVATLPELEG